MNPRFHTIKPDRHAPKPPAICDVEDQRTAQRAWFAMLPVRVPAAVAARMSDTIPLIVRDVPRVATTSAGCRLRVSCLVTLLRVDATPCLILKGQDAEELIAVVSLVDADAAIRMAELLRDIEGEAVELRLTDRATLAAVIFGGAS